MTDQQVSNADPCVKCGGTEIKTQWFEKTKEDNEGGILLQPPVCSLDYRPEHLHRTCSCGWRWCDPVLNKKVLDDR